MNYLRLAYNIVVVICVVFFIFHPKTVLGFWATGIKKVFMGIYNRIKGLIKK